MWPMIHLLGGLCTTSLRLGLISDTEGAPASSETTPSPQAWLRGLPFLTLHLGSTPVSPPCQLRPVPLSWARIILSCQHPPASPRPQSRAGHSQPSESGPRRPPPRLALPWHPAPQPGQTMTGWPCLTSPSLCAALPGVPSPAVCLAVPSLPCDPGPCPSPSPLLTLPCPRLDAALISGGNCVETRLSSPLDCEVVQFHSCLCPQLFSRVWNLAGAADVCWRNG